MFVVVNGDDDELKAVACCKALTIQRAADIDRKNVIIKDVYSAVSIMYVLEVYGRYTSRGILALL